MKQKHWRLTILPLLVLGLSLATILTTRADEYCYIDDIEDVVTSVEVTLTASPTSGPPPLSVSFPTCTAKAIIHYEDKVCITQTEEEGSVENRTPHYKEESITPTCPADCTLEASGTYPFTATAESEEVTGSATVTVVVADYCADVLEKTSIVIFGNSWEHSMPWNILFRISIAPGASWSFFGFSIDIEPGEPIAFLTVSDHKIYVHKKAKEHWDLYQICFLDGEEISRELLEEDFRIVECVVCLRIIWELKIEVAWGEHHWDWSKRIVEVDYYPGVE